MLSDFGRDFRYAVRALLRTPTFAATVVATLALGIGRTRLSSAPSTRFFFCATRRLPTRIASSPSIHPPATTATPVRPIRIISTCATAGRSPHLRPTRKCP